MLLPLLATLASPQIDLALTPSELCVTPNAVVEVELELSGPPPAEAIAGIDLILTWDPAELLLFEAVGLGANWLAAGFLPDPDGINLSTTDGDALFTLLASPAQPPTVPPGLTAARFRFVALDDGAIQVPASLGANGMTQIIGVGAQPPLTGALPLPVGVGVAPATQAVESLRLGTPPNPAAFLPGQTSGPVLGQVWDPFVDHTSFLPAAILDLLAVTLGPAELQIPPYGTLLCQLPIAVGPISTAPGVPFQVALPDDCVLVGLALCTQAFSADALGNVRLTNALDITLGTF